MNAGALRRGTPLLAAAVAVAAAAGCGGSDGPPVIAVGPLETSARNISCEGWDRSIHDCNRDLTEGFRTMLRSAIARTGKVAAMEPDRWDGLVAEHGLDEAHLADRTGRIRRLTGADWFVRGTITRFGDKERQLRLGGAGLTKASALTEMGVDVTVTEVGSGRVVFSDTITTEVSRGAFLRAAGLRRTAASADPFADVLEASAARIAEAVVTDRFPIRVVEVESEGGLVLNYGAGLFSPGDRLAGYAAGEPGAASGQTGPDSGGTAEVGVVEIVDVGADFARARTVAGAVGRGSSLRRLTAAEQAPRERPRSGPAW